MQLLTQYLDPAEATVANRQLRAAGVLCVVRDVDPHAMQPSKTGTRRIGLWVVLDEQFDDAVALLQNPDHEPTRRLDDAEMRALESEVTGSTDRLCDEMRKPILTAVGALLLLLLLFLILN